MRHEDIFSERGFLSLPKGFTDRFELGNRILPVSGKAMFIKLLLPPVFQISTQLTIMVSKAAFI